MTTNATYQLKNILSGKVEQTEYLQNFFNLLNPEKAAYDGCVAIQDTEVFGLVNELYPLAVDNSVLHRIIQEVVLKALNIVASNEARGVYFVGNEPTRNADGTLITKAVESVLSDWALHPLELHGWRRDTD